MLDLAKIFKAYDIRGVVPDELDEDLAEAVGAAFVRLTAPTAIVTAHDMRDSAVPLAAAFAARRDAAGRRRDQGRARLHRPALLRQRHPRPARRDVHRQPQPGRATTASSCAARAPSRSAATPGSPRSATMVEAGVARRRRPGRHLSERDLLDRRTPTHLQSLVDLSGIRPLKVVVDAGNGMGGHTVPAVFERPAGRRSSRSTSSWTARFPNHEANPIDPENLRRPAGRGARERRRHRAWPSTATPTAASSSTSAASGRRPRPSPR